MNSRPRRGPGRPPKAESGDTKAALVEAGLTLFARHGYAGTSIRAIAREVGLSESVLYAHFTSKREVYDAVIESTGPQVALAALASMPAGTGPEEFIRGVAARVITAWDTPQARKVISLVSRDGLVHEKALTDGIRQAVAGLAEIFAGWITEKKIRDDLGSPDDLAWALLSPIAHARLLWLHDGASPELREAARDRVTRHAALFARAVTP